MENAGNLVSVTNKDISSGIEESSWIYLLREPDGSNEYFAVVPNFDDSGWAPSNVKLLVLIRIDACQTFIMVHEVFGLDPHELFLLFLVCEKL